MLQYADCIDREAYRRAFGMPKLYKIERNEKNEPV